MLWLTIVAINLMSIGKSSKALGSRVQGKTPIRRSNLNKLPIRRRLDRAQVLEAARALSDVSGVGALSIKELADQLKIRPPSVYAHFGGLTELRRELALWAYRAITRKMTEAAVGLAGKDALLALGHAYLEFIRASPGLYSAIVSSPDVADTELRAAGVAWLAVFECVLATLGLPAEHATHALRGIRSIVHGFGMLETNGAFLTPVDRDTSFRHVLQTFVEGIEHGRAIVGSVGNPEAPSKGVAGRKRVLKTASVAKRDPAV